MQGQSIRVLVVDDHGLVRTGLRRILNESPDIEVAGEAASGEEALQMHREIAPDVVLLDISMPGLSGFEVCQRLQERPEPVKVIILTVHARGPYPSQLLDAGANGYLTKGCGAGELQEAIRKVHAGSRYVGSDIAQQLALSLLPGQRQSPFENLSAREMEVALMLTEGHELAHIAESLNLSPKTVATYKYRVLEKTGTKNEVGLLRLALEHGLIEER